MSSSSSSSIPPPADISSIVPGSIFQDEIPPPSFTDGTYEPPQLGSSSSSSSSSSTRNSSSSSTNNHVQIEVNSTIQTVLISLGICVGALFLLGVIATQYISHKNKRAEEKKKHIFEENGVVLPSEDGDAKGEKSGGASGSSPRTTTTIGGASAGGRVGKSDMVTVLIDEKDGSFGGGAGAGIGHDLVGPNSNTLLRGNSKNSRLYQQATAKGASSPGNHITQSPKRSIIGGVGTAVGGGGHAGTGSFQMGASGPRGPGGVNPRNSFMEVAHVYARRQSITPTPIPSSTGTMSGPSNTNGVVPLKQPTPGYSHEHHHLGAPPELQLSNNGLGGGGLNSLGLGSGLSMYSDGQGGFSSSHDLLSSPMFAISPSSFGATGEDDEDGRTSPGNPFASPPLSAGSKSSMLLDPFRTQNNSQLSLHLTMTHEDDSVGGRNGGDSPDGDEDPYPFPTHIVESNSPNYNQHHPIQNKPMHQKMAMPLSVGQTTTKSPLQSIMSASTSSSNGNTTSGPGAAIPRSLDDLTETKLALRQIHSAVPAYHRHNVHPGGSPTTGNATVGGSPSSNVFGSPGSPAATARSTVERQVGFSPGIVHDRRSIAGSVVVTPTSASASNSSFSSSASSSCGYVYGGGGGHGRGPHSSNGSVNEGNAWYRKRASVIIPDSGSAHVRLWKDGGEPSSSGSMSGIIINRASRSGSQSSSQSQSSSSSATAAAAAATMSAVSAALASATTPAVVPSPLRSHQERSTLDDQNHHHHHHHSNTSDSNSKEEQHSLGLSPKTAMARNGAAVFEGTAGHNKSGISRSPSPSRSNTFNGVGAGGRRGEGNSTLGLGGTPLVIEPEQEDSSSSNSSDSIGRSKEEEEVDQVIVRLRAPRRGSHAGSIGHSPNRQSYLDDYREQQKQQQQL